MKVEKTNEKNSLDLNNIKLNAVKSFSFELEIPEFESYLEDAEIDEKQALAGLMSPIKVSDETSNQKNENINNASALQNLQELAKQDNIPVRISKIDDIRLFIRAQDIYNFQDGYKVKLESLTKDDIDFVKQCFEHKDITLNNINSQQGLANFAILNQNGQVQYKSYNFSKGLFNLIEYSFKSQKPVRLDFHGNSSVILKMNTEGKLIAEFISNDKAMEYVLKSSIPHLKNKLDSEGIPYKEILYKDNPKDKRKNKGGNQ